MPSLIIHTPDYQLVREGTISFEDSFSTGVGRGFALNRTILRQIIPSGEINPGWRVVLLCKNRRLRAEGNLVKLIPAEIHGAPWFTKNGIRRYDVHMENLVMVQYRPEPLNRNGVGVTYP